MSAFRLNPLDLNFGMYGVWLVVCGVTVEENVNARRAAGTPLRPSVPTECQPSQCSRCRKIVQHDQRRRNRTTTTTDPSVVVAAVVAKIPTENANGARNPSADTARRNPNEAGGDRDLSHLMIESDIEDHGPNLPMIGNDLGRNPKSRAEKSRVSLGLFIDVDVHIRYQVKRKLSCIISSASLSRWNLTSCEPRQHLRAINVIVLKAR